MCVCACLLLVFFFKQKTAYEMRISDWSSDVCSSDLLKVEGLVENRGGSPDERKGDDPESDDQELTVTAEGRAELRRLLSANVRPQVSDLNKLVIALKMRFLHLKIGSAHV